MDRAQPEATVNQLASQLAGFCAEHRFQEKWLVAPPLRVGYQWLETVTRGGHTVLNVRVEMLKDLALTGDLSILIYWRV